MRRRSKGLNEFFFTLGPLWKIHGRIRLLRERKRTGAEIISPDWHPISAEPEIDIPQNELTPWLQLLRPSYGSTLAVWDKDFWMTQEVYSISASRNILMKVYNTFISRNEQQFYLDYCPIRWEIRESGKDIWKRCNDVIELLKPSITFACNFAVSCEPIRPSIRRQAKENNIQLYNPKSEHIVLWARYDFLRRSESGCNMIRYYKALGINALKYGLPICPLNN